jgi:hypothetical protein
MDAEVQKAISDLNAVSDDTAKMTQAQKLVELCGDCALFKTSDGDGFATVTVDSHKETWQIRSKGFRNWISRRYFDKHKGVAGAQALQDALCTLEGKAQFEGETHEVHLRIGWYNSKIYLDLADEQWSVVEIDSSGFRVLKDSPVKFRRPGGMSPLPYPLVGDPQNGVEVLKKYLNAGESLETFKLAIAWLLSAYNPNGPFPVLVPYGEQGTGKSTFVRVLRELIDPNTAPLRKEPRNSDDLMVSAKSNWVMAFDNVSRLSDDMSDDICRASTGGAITKRALYTDDGEIVLNAKRPCILNGIEEFVSRGDLANRSIVISLPSIDEKSRKREETFWKDFAADKPSILGAMLSAVSRAIQDKDSFNLDRLPRMADAFHWVSAAETAFGWARGDCLRAFEANQKQSNETVLASSPLYRHIVKYAEQGFEGTADLLLRNIRTDADSGDLRYLPANTKSLGDKLRRLNPALRSAGIAFTKVKKESGVVYSLIKSPEKVARNVSLVSGPKRYAPPGPGNDDPDESADQISMNSVEANL